MLVYLKTCCNMLSSLALLSNLALKTQNDHILWKVYIQESSSEKCLHLIPGLAKFSHTPSEAFVP